MVKELIRRKDFYLIFALLLVIILYAAGVSFGGQRGFERYFREIGISFAYIFSVLIAILFAARQIPQEVETKTIYPVLARLETDGLVTSYSQPSTDGPPRKYFRLTEAGQTALEDMNKHWDQLISSFESIRKGTGL